MNSPKFYSPKCIGRRFTKVLLRQNFALYGSELLVEWTVHANLTKSSRLTTLYYNRVNTNNNHACSACLYKTYAYQLPRILNSTQVRGWIKEARWVLQKIILGVIINKLMFYHLKTRRCVIYSTMYYNNYIN